MNIGARNRSGAWPPARVPEESRGVTERDGNGWTPGKTGQREASPDGAHGAVALGGVGACHDHRHSSRSWRVRLVTRYNRKSARLSREINGRSPDPQNALRLYRM